MSRFVGWALVWVAGLLLAGCHTRPAYVAARPPTNAVLRVAPLPAVPSNASPVVSLSAVTAAPPAVAGGPEAVTGAVPRVESPEKDVYIIQPLDVLEIFVFREPELSREFKVAASGNVQHPLLGPVKLAGMSVRQAELYITQELSRDYLINPKVNITLKTSSSRRIMVFGEVKTPGSYDIDPEQPFTLLSAIARAGGFSNLAAENRVQIVRSRGGKEQTVTVSVGDIFRGREKDYVLEPGDVIKVPQVNF